MAKRDCEICGDRGVVELLVRQPFRMPLPASGVGIAEINQTSRREFPCPECAGTIPPERLSIIDFSTEHTADPSMVNDPRYIDGERRHMATTIAMIMLQRGLIRFTRGKFDQLSGSVPMRAVVGVVSPKDVDSIEKRIAEHQEVVAGEVVEEAIKQVSNWNSHYDGYGSGTISKQVAVDFVRKALQTVLKRRGSAT